MVIINDSCPLQQQSGQNSTLSSVRSCRIIIPCSVTCTHNPDVDIGSLTWMVQRGAGRHSRLDGSHHDFSLIGVLMGHIWAPQMKVAGMRVRAVFDGDHLSVIVSHPHVI